MRPQPHSTARAGGREGGREGVPVLGHWEERSRRGGPPLWPLLWQLLSTQTRASPRQHNKTHTRHQLHIKQPSEIEWRLKSDKRRGLSKLSGGPSSLTCPLLVVCRGCSLQQTHTHTHQRHKQDTWSGNNSRGTCRGVCVRKPVRERQRCKDDNGSRENERFRP